MSLLDREPLASFFGRGTASITVPTLDGALRPNDLVEQASLIGDYPDADTIMAGAGGLLLAAGNRLLALKGSSTEIVAQFDAPVSALAAAGDAIAVGLATGGVRVLAGPSGPRTIAEVAGRPISCPTALLFDGDRLIVADGSATNGPAQWSRDLLERNASGRVVAVDLATGRGEELATGLAYPNGLALVKGAVVVSQSWRHDIVRLDRSSRRSVLTGGLPGYPSRLAPAGDGGHWLAVFGMRTQLLEFVLREPEFRRRMLATVPPEFWVAPSLQSRENFLDPLQQGAVKQLGIKKPWAPPRSYGLVIKLDAAFNAEWSLHSRVGGARHGVTSVCEQAGTLYVVSKGAGQVLAVDLAAAREGIVT